MNPPEKIVNLYLRLNGFFTMPSFTAIGEKNRRHTDILAVRLPGSIEKIGSDDDPRSQLGIDEEFFNFLGKNKNDPICLICEVKGGSIDRETIDKFREYEAIEYFKNIFGKYNNIVQIVLFTKKPIQDAEDLKVYKLKNCIKFIESRFEEAQEISDRLGRPSKTGSWAWSEDFLSTLLYLNNLKKL